MSHQCDLCGALNENPRVYPKGMDVVLLICAENGGNMDPSLQEAKALGIEREAFELFVTYFPNVAWRKLIKVDLSKTSLDELLGLLQVVDERCP